MTGSLGWIDMFIQKWEYRSHTRDSRSVSQFAQLGTEGWELVTVLLLHHGLYEFYFRRPIPDTRPRYTDQESAQ